MEKQNLQEKKFTKRLFFYLCLTVRLWRFFSITILSVKIYKTLSDMRKELQAIRKSKEFNEDDMIDAIIKANEKHSIVTGHNLF